MGKGPSTTAMLSHAIIGNRRPLLGVARRILGDGPAAEDVVQSLWFRVQTLDERMTVRDSGAFLRRLVRNLAIDQLRKDRVRHEYFHDTPPDDAIPDDAPDAEQAMIDRDRLRRLKLALEELPPRCREVFVLRRIHDLSSAEIAERLGISQNAVAKHVRLALQHCHSRLAEAEQG